MFDVTYQPILTSFITTAYLILLLRFFKINSLTRICERITISHFRKAFNYLGLLYNNHHHNVLEIQILRKNITCVCKQKFPFSFF